eukprot:scaffold91_cov127-Cylindrotheca_fusiformis.AAC.18
MHCVFTRCELFPSLSPVSQFPLFDFGRSAIEYQNRANAGPSQLQQPSNEKFQRQRPPIFCIADNRQKLCQPNTSIDCQHFSFQRFY